MRRGGESTGNPKREDRFSAGLSAHCESAAPVPQVGCVLPGEDLAKRNDSIGYGIVRPRVALQDPGDA
jgi:hypothetical protein